MLPKPGFRFTVEYDGKTVDYTEEDGKIVVTVPLTNGKVEIIGK